MRRNTHQVGDGRFGWWGMRAALAFLWALSAIPAGAQWQPTKTVGSGGDASGQPPRLAVDAQGNPTIVYAAGPELRAVTGASDGTWLLPEPLGPIDPIAKVATALAVSPNGKALAAWVDGTVIRTATRPLGGTWTVPAAGQPGSWTVLPGTAIGEVLVAIDSQGRGAVTWEQQANGPQVALVVEGPGGWPGVPEVTPLPALGGGQMLRADDSSVFLLVDAGGLRSLRRTPDGMYADSGPGAAGSIEGLVGDPASGVAVGGAYDGSAFTVQRTTIGGGAGSTTVFSEPATRPALQEGALAGGVGLRVASGEATGAWLRSTQAGRQLRAVAETGGTATAVTLPALAPSSVGVARTAGDDSVVVYTQSSAPLSVRGFTRTPCAAGDWDAGRDLDTGGNYGAVRAAGGGNVAVAVWVDTGGQVRAALFQGTPVPPGGVCPAPACFSAAAIPSFGTDTVTLLDVDGGRVLATDATGDAPYGVAVHPTTDASWVTNREADSVSVLDRENGNRTIPVGGKPLGIAFNPGGTRAYVSNYDPDTVTILDTATFAPVPGPPIRVGAGPTGVAIGGGGTRLWTANYAANNVSMLDLSTEPPTPRTSRLITFRPLGIAESPDGTRVVVSGFKSGRAIVLDAATMKIIKRIRVGRNPTGVAFHPTIPTRAFVASRGKVSLIDTGTNRLTGSIPAGKNPYGVAVNAAGTRLYVVESGDGTGPGNLLVWDLVGNLAVARYPVGRLPVALGTFLLHQPVCP